MSKSHSYKQPPKNQSRERIWEHAVKSLTQQRSKTQLLKIDYFEKMRDYFFKEFFQKYDIPLFPDDSVFLSWSNFVSSSYGEKKPEDLRIAYFCGPEPENDLEVLKKLGVIVENVWAVEKEDNAYQNALSKAKERFPELKIFSGNMTDLLDLVPAPFDIIYLDFTQITYKFRNSEITSQGI